MSVHTLVRRDGRSQARLMQHRPACGPAVLICMKNRERTRKVPIDFQWTIKKMPGGGTSAFDRPLQLFFYRKLKRPTI